MKLADIEAELLALPAEDRARLAEKLLESLGPPTVEAGPFDLDDEQLKELEARIAEAERGEIVPAATVLERLRRRR